MQIDNSLSSKRYSLFSKDQFFNSFHSNYEMVSQKLLSLAPNDEISGKLERNFI